MADSAEAKAAAIKEMQLMLNHAPESETGPDARMDKPVHIDQPGQPDTLTMVHPRELSRRKLGTPTGRACFLHAIAHIEFNAINLALDAVYRFTGLPWSFYKDWLQVAAEEAQHHQMLISLMNELGCHYGDFTVHNGLWDIARRTDSDLLSRMALVPCVLEARGLDVTPSMINRLEEIGDNSSAAVLRQILDEEVEHVAIGLAWYTYTCRLQGLDPIDQFITLVNAYLPNRLQGPFNEEKRKLAGFSQGWIARIRQLDQGNTRL